MSNEGCSLESLAMRSSEVVTSTRTTMPVPSISTTIGLTTTTTTSGSADPTIQCLDIEHAHGKPILGREHPRGNSESTAQITRVQPETVAGLTSAAAECGESVFYRLTSLENLFGCWLHTRKNKSGSLRIQRFAEDPLRHLVTIQERLRARQYSFGPYKTFTVREKKFRDVVDAPMKDRIVHWMLYQYLLPIWQPRFIHDTYGNLPWRGTHAAIVRVADFARRDDAVWVLQLDISKYFYSVNHSLLKERALRYIGDQDLRMLIVDLVDSYRTDDRYDYLFAADTLYRKTPAKGMPIGNLSSQLFANMFLNEFDHWLKEIVGVRYYVRYVDDMVILGKSSGQLQSICQQIVDKLAIDGLTIHPRKIRLAKASAGIPFLGYVVWPNHISAGQYVRRRYHQRLRQHESGIRDRTEALQAYSAMFNHTGATR